MHSSDIEKIPNVLRDAAIQSYRASVLTECYAAIDKLAKELFELSEMFKPDERKDLIFKMGLETADEIENLLTAKVEILNCTKYENWECCKYHKESENGRRETGNSPEGGT